MSKIRWGVLGTARIAEQQVIPAIQAAGNGCSFDTFDRQYLQIAGTKGTLTLALPFRPDLGRATLTVETKDYKEVKTFEPFNMYVREVEHFADCVVHGESPRHSLEDSIQNMKLIEMVYNAAGRDI